MPGEIEIRLDEFGIDEIVSVYPCVSLLRGQLHLRRHSVLESLSSFLLVSVDEVGPVEHVLQLPPRILIQQHVQALYEHDIVLLFVEGDLAFFRISNSMIESREQAFASSLGGLDIFDEFLSVEGEGSTAPSVGLLGIGHLIKLRAVVVVAVHADDEGIDSIALQDLDQFVTGITLSCAGDTSQANEWSGRGVPHNLHQFLRKLLHLQVRLVSERNELLHLAAALGREVIVVFVQPNFRQLHHILCDGRAQ